MISPANRLVLCHCTLIHSVVKALASALLLVVLFWTTAGTVSAAQLTNRQVAATIERCFASRSGYRDGSLICRSQVVKIQNYLRKTQGGIPASHQRLLNRVLADEAPLTRLFYTERGEAVLCAAAEKLAGYAELDLAARSVAGHKQIEAAIRSNQSDALVKFIKK